MAIVIRRLGERDEAENFDCAKRPSTTIRKTAPGGKEMLLRRRRLLGVACGFIALGACLLPASAQDLVRTASEFIAQDIGGVLL